MPTELTRAEIENNVAFLERCQLTGKEAETMVRLKYKLVAMRNEKLAAETPKNPPAKPPSKPRSRGNGKPRK